MPDPYLFRPTYFAQIKLALGCIEQFAVGKRRPAFFCRGCDFMLREVIAQRRGRPLIKENAHENYVTARLCSAHSSTASTCSRFTPGNHSRN